MKLLYEKKLLILEKQLENTIGSKYENAIRIIVRSPLIKKYIESGKEINISKDAALKKIIETEIKRLSESLQAVVLSGIQQSKEYGNDVYTEKMLALSTSDKMSDYIRNSTQIQQTFAAAQVAKRELNKKISDDIWGIVDILKPDIEVFVNNAILSGKSADSLSRDIRKYLNNPNRLFRRVRNKETGKLQLSKAARNYHPGQGVYRSSYKNAMRLARTEINIAYRESELERYRGEILVKGYRIELSNNHPVMDICDDLKGEYPKTFKWSGWHPACRCRMIPILMSDIDFEKLIRAKETGSTFAPENEIKKPPKNFNKYIKANNSRIQKGKSIPYWYADNARVIKNIL